jgi:hypothetical protein
MRRAVITTLTLAGAAFMITTSTNGCTVGNGTGSVTGDLFVTDCWSGKFDLQPDFFAATPNTDDSLIIRIQHGSDYVNFSDGLSILVTSVSTIRAAIDNDGGMGQPQTFPISLPPSVLDPGTPLTYPPPPGAQFALFLQSTCGVDTPGLYGMNLVTTDVPSSDGGAICSAATAAAVSQCDGGMPPATGSSTITFQHIFDASLANGGDPGSLSAEQRLTQATFDVLLGDPRMQCPGSTGPPPACEGHLTGSFSFYFERGKPAQAFP